MPAEKITLSSGTEYEIAPLVLGQIIQVAGKIIGSSQTLSGGTISEQVLNDMVDVISIGFGIDRAQFLQEQVSFKEIRDMFMMVGRQAGMLGASTGEAPAA